MPVVRTDGLLGGRAVYGHVITIISRIGRLLHFLTHGAHLERFARESSAVMALDYRRLIRPGKNYFSYVTSEVNITSIFFSFCVCVFCSCVSFVSDP